MTSWQKFAAGTLLVFLTLPAFAHHLDPIYDPTENAPKFSAEKTGTIPTKPGLSLRLNAAPGNIRILTDESAQVSYRVVVEADSRDPGSEAFLRQFILTARRIPAGVSLESKLPWQSFHGQFGVSFEIHIPRKYSLKITTQGGNIDVQDIEGQVDLVTEGGNITVGNVGSPANTEDVRARPSTDHATQIAARLETQGGHIIIGDVAGTLRATTSGGHIAAGNIGGNSILRTGGGNIRVRRSSSSVTADTNGGQIDFGEAAGSIRTHTNGGGVHIDHVTGSTVVENSAGGISVREVNAPLRVSSGEGDLVVYLPSQLNATVDAVVERRGGHMIVSDPELPLKFTYQDSGAGHETIQGKGNLNDGGEALHLKTASGNIILKVGEPRPGWSNAFQAAWMPAETELPEMQAWNSDQEATGLFEEVRRKILESWWGGVPIDAGEMQSHLEHSVAPLYPDVARVAGIEGDVTLRVYVSGDGRVTDVRILDGPPILARAAVAAVQQWQYQSLLVNGQPTNVVTTVVVAFRLK